MAFDRLRLAPDGASGGLNRTFYYNSEDTLDDMLATGYFDDASGIMNTGDFVNLSSLSDNRGGQFTVASTDGGIILATSVIATYDYEKVIDTLDIPDTFTTLIDLDIPDRVAGLYEVGISGTFTYDTQSQSIFIRFSIDGGATWNTFAYEPSDASNVIPLTYIFPYEWAGGTGNFILQASKESATGTLDCLFADVWFKSLGVV